jgi:hypothetical protein
VLKEVLANLLRSGTTRDAIPQHCTIGCSFRRRVSSPIQTLAAVRASRLRGDYCAFSGTRSTLKLRRAGIICKRRECQYLGSSQYPHRSEKALLNRLRLRRCKSWFLQCPKACGSCGCPIGVKRIHFEQFPRLTAGLLLRIAQSVKAFPKPFNGFGNDNSRAGRRLIQRDV